MFDKITHIYIELSSISPWITEKKYGYVLAVEGMTKTRESFGKIKDSYHSVSLAVMVQALRRYRVPSEIHIHMQDEYIKTAFDSYLDGWEANDFHNAKGQPIKDREKWRELRDLSQKHLIYIETGKHEYSNWILGEFERRL
jgi:ribonuclease HI